MGFCKGCSFCSVFLDDTRSWKIKTKLSRFSMDMSDSTLMTLERDSNNLAGAFGYTQSRVSQIAVWSLGA